MDPESIDYLCTTPDKCHNPFVTFTSAKITYCPTDNFLSHVYIDFRCSKVPKVANVICCKSMLIEQTPEFPQSSVAHGSEKVAFAGEQVSSVGSDIRFTGIKPSSTGEQGSSAGEEVPPLENFSFADLQLPSLGEQLSLPELWSPLIESQLPSAGQHDSFSDTPTASPGNLFASSYQDSYASEGAGNTIVSIGTSDRVTEDITANDFV